MLVKFKDKYPVIDDNCFIAINSTIIGDCHIGKNSSVWFNAVLRGDDNKIKIGFNTNIQDGCIIHVTHNEQTIIGNYVTIGHGAIIHSCMIKDNCLIGMGSTILEGAVIEEDVIIGANSLVTSGKTIPKGSLAVGSPAKVIRQLSKEEIESIKNSAEVYTKLMKYYIE